TPIESNASVRFTGRRPPLTRLPHGGRHHDTTAHDIGRGASEAFVSDPAGTVLTNRIERAIESAEREDGADGALGGGDRRASGGGGLRVARRDEREAHPRGGDGVRGRGGAPAGRLLGREGLRRGRGPARDPGVPRVARSDAGAGARTPRAGGPGVDVAAAGDGGPRLRPGARPGGGGRGPDGAG